MLENTAIREIRSVVLGRDLGKFIGNAVFYAQTLFDDLIRALCDIIWNYLPMEPVRLVGNKPISDYLFEQGTTDVL